VSGREVPDTS